jgi:hypothetical protein
MKKTKPVGSNPKTPRPKRPKVSKVKNNGKRTK